MGYNESLMRARLKWCQRHGLEPATSTLTGGVLYQIELRRLLKLACRSLGKGRHSHFVFLNLADGEGFEPPRPFGPSVFGTAAATLNLSAYPSFIGWIVIE